MRERLFFVTVFALLLSLKEPQWLLVAAVLLWAVSFREFVMLNRKVIKAFILFNLGVSIGYLIVSYFKSVSPWEYLLYINLKVYVMTYFVFWFFGRVNLLAFVSFSQTLSYLMSISLSQIYSYKKSFEDFVLAYRSRVIHKMRSREYSFIGRVFEFFFTKAMQESKERALAMKARGFFDQA